ncbi:hypothetical protein VTO73DRAFT_11016 [Trametes versicolor]
MADTTPDRGAHAEPEARISDAGQPDRTDPPTGFGTEPSGTSAAPPPQPSYAPVSQENEDDDDEDTFIPRGQSVQTAAAGGKKGGRPR